MHWLIETALAAPAGTLNSGMITKPDTVAATPATTNTGRSTKPCSRER
jgi:hypothetical protein